MSNELIKTKLITFRLTGILTDTSGSLGSFISDDTVT